MLKDETLRLLLGANAPLSGEELSRRLGVTRAAVWKTVETLRAEGWQVGSHPGKGYTLDGRPDLLSPVELEREGWQVVCLDSVDSTNNECRRRAAQNAPGCLAVLAGEQTVGKGRRGRSFQSLADKGLYLSVLLRPKAETPLEEVTQLTAWSAVAVCRAIEKVTSLAPEIKWTNDILLGGKKVCGILSELGLDDDGRADYVVVGIGVNVSQTPEDFGPELDPIATSLGQFLDRPPRRGDLAAALIGELDQLWRAFPQGKGEVLAEYRERCVTVGRAIRVIRPDRSYEAQALEVGGDFSLLVGLPDGEQERIFTGEVSVRGLMGYI